MTDPKAIATALRKQAAELRKQAEYTQREKLIKSAQVLTAAKGLVAFKAILQGGRDVG
jgi:hypothetical protein